MPGFRITNIKNNLRLSDYNDSMLLYNQINKFGYYVDRNTLDKFMLDKIFDITEKYIIILEGVILNSDEIQNKYHNFDWLSTIIFMIDNNGIEWFKELEGPVSGAVYYQEKNRWVIFTGHLGEKAIFYWLDEKSNKFIVGSQIIYITDLLKTQNIEPYADQYSVLHLMAYGSYIGEETCIKGVKRVYPGNYIIIEECSIKTIEYSKLDVAQDKKAKSEDEYIELLDEKFKRAMKRILKKNYEYGYKTVVDLSGGYDSRLNTYVLKDLNAENVITDCYGQTSCLDSKVSREISSELGFDYVFLSLDSGNCLYRIDDNVKMLNGCSWYYGITGGRDMLQMLSGFNIGLEITGLLGDVHDGSMVVNYCDGLIDKNSYRFTRTLVEGIDFEFPMIENNRFNNHINEHFWFYNRGLICGMSTFFLRQNFTEAVTPFGDVEFVKLYFSIPWEIRVKNKLLRKWLAKKYPSSSKYISGTYGISLRNDVRFYSNYLMLWNKIIKKLDKCLRNKKWNAVPHGMNDINFWYLHNDKLRSYIDGYIAHNKFRIEKYPILKSKIEKLENSSDIKDKFMVANVLAIIKEFC